MPARGVRVVIASARPPRSVRHIYQMLRLDTWQINYNGALIWDEPNRRPVFHRPMGGELVRRMVDRRATCSTKCSSPAKSWTAGSPIAPTNLHDRNRPAVQAGRNRPLDEFCNQPVTKLMFLGEPRMIDRLEPLLIEEFREHVAFVVRMTS